jgi:hypothetical protein
VCETDLVLPKRGDYGRAKRRIEAALEPVPASADAVVETFLTSVAELLDLHSSCWHQSDPASGSPVCGAVLRYPPGSFMESMQYEFRRRDVNTFADLTRDRSGVGSIFLATAERPGTSLRFREMIEPTGVCDELRVWLKDAFGVWATVVAFTRRRMNQADVRFVADVAPIVTRVPQTRRLGGAWSCCPITSRRGSRA